MIENSDKSCDPELLIQRYKKHGFDPLRIESVTEQLRQICYSQCSNILEVGIAGGVLRHFFELFPQISHTTIDIAEDFSPDHVGSVTEMPFEDGQFDMILCCQVLEHLPFSEFLPALKELKRVTSEKVILSLPDKTRHFGVAVCLARLGWFSFEWNPVRIKYALRGLQSKGQHCWEIGCKGTLQKDIVRSIKEAGFEIEKHYRLYRYPWHHFFILGV